jgi:hypothetical protein
VPPQGQVRELLSARFDNVASQNEVHAGSYEKFYEIVAGYGAYQYWYRRSGITPRFFTHAFRVGQLATGGVFGD